MGVLLKWGSMSGIADGEIVQHAIPSIGFSSSLSFPSYRLCFPVPLLWRVSIYVTSRRFLLVAYLFSIVVQELHSWFPGWSPSGDAEYVASVRVGQHAIAGPHLEVVSRNQSRPWYWRCLCSPSIRMRFYMRQPHHLCSLIQAQMEGKAASQQDAPADADKARR